MYTLISVPRSDGIIVGAALMLLYRRAFTGIETKKNYLILLPALLFAAWNLFYNLSLGLEIGGSVYFMEAALTAFAPALFEEVLFRGIFLYNLKKTGRSDLACMLGYSLVIGMVLAAVYLKNNSILQVIALHFLIDFMPRIFVEQAVSATTMHIVLFVILLVAEAAYAVKLCLPDQKKSSAAQ